MRMTRKRRRAQEKKACAEENWKQLTRRSAALAASALLLWNAADPNTLSAMPTGGEVAAGSATITQAGKTMTIAQQTAQAILNWRNFGILPGEHVQFLQPGADSVALNRVLGNDPSAIFGKLTANGKVFLVNPNGVFFAPGAQVNVGGLVATTLRITDADFMAGRYAFVQQDGAGSVVNQGQIIAENQGLVALLAPEVKNEGVIIAKKGAVALGAGSAATLDFNGDGRVLLEVDSGAYKAAIENRGLVEADGGVVLMTARGGQDLTSSVVNQDGVVRARSLDGAAGKIALDAGSGTTSIGGTIDVSGENVHHGGAFDAFGRVVALKETASIDARGASGGGSVRIGGDWQGAGEAPHAETVTIAKGAAIDASATQRGDGGTVAVWSDGTTRFDGAITARGGALGGDGGKVETSGHVLQATGKVDAAAKNGKGGLWLLDPYDVTIKDTATAGGSFGGSNLNTFVPNAEGSTVNAADINAALNGGTSVTITTGGGATGQLGDITVDAAITKSNGADATLKLQADGSIIVNQTITSNAGKLNVDLYADANATAGGKIVINAGSTITTNDGWVKLSGGTNGYAYNVESGGTGALVAGQIQAGTGAIEIYGQGTGTNSKGIQVTGTLAGGSVLLQGLASEAGTGIDLGGATITADKVTLIGDSMKLDTVGAVTGQDTLWIKTLTSGKTIGLGSGGGDLQINNLNQFSNFATTQIGSKDAGKITVSGMTSSGDLWLQTGGAIALDGALTADGKTVTLDAKSGVSGDGIITAKTLDLKTANVSLTGEQKIDTLVGTVNQIELKNGKALAVGTVEKGLTVKAASTLETTSGDVTVAGKFEGAGLTVNSAGGVRVENTIDSKNGAVNLTANSALSLGSTARITAGTGEITLRATSLTSAAAAKAVSGKKLTLDNSADNGGIRIGSGGNGLQLHAVDFAANGVFSATFGNGIQIGRQENTGDVTIGEALSTRSKLTVNGGAVSFADGGALQSSGGMLTVNANSIAFNGATPNKIAAGTGTVTLNTNAITGWAKSDFTGNSGGKLVIAPKTSGQALYVGGDSENTPLAITQKGLANIFAGGFEEVTIGDQNTAGQATLNAFDMSGGAENLKLTIHGGSGSTIAGGTIVNRAGQTLALNLGSLTNQASGSKLSIGGILALKGGAFTLNAADNTISAVTADNTGALTLSGSSLGIGSAGVKATDIVLTTDGISQILGNITASGDFTLKKLMDGNININTAQSNDLHLTSEQIQKITANGGNGIILGAQDYNGTINIGQAGQQTMFNSKLQLLTDQTSSNSVNLAGKVYVGTAPSYQDLLIHTYAASLPNASELYVKDLILEIASGLTGLNGKVIGTGELTVNGPASGDIYISNGSGDGYNGKYVISYNVLNNVLTGFGGFAVKGHQDIYVEGNNADRTGSELKSSVKIETDNASSGKIVVNGAVEIGGDGTKAELTGTELVFKDSASLELTGTNGDVAFTADKTTLGANSQVNVGSGSFTLTTDQLTAESDAKIIGAGSGSGTLTVQQKSADMDVVADGTTVTNGHLTITAGQLNGGLFGTGEQGFGSLKLGNENLNKTVTVENVALNTDVTIQTGGGDGGTIEASGLTIQNGHEVTLRGNKVVNNEGTIDGGTGAINFYVNDLNGLTGTGVVKGTGALGIGTYDGTTEIILGTSGSGLVLNDAFFTKEDSVFAKDFTSYTIGSKAQQKIAVDGLTLGKNLKLIGKDIDFKGNLTLNGATGQNNLTIQSTGYVGQHDGTIDATSDAPQATNSKIAVNDLTLEGGADTRFNLNSTSNTIGGTVNGTGKRVNVASNALKVGAITVEGGDLILSANTMDFTGASLQTKSGTGLLTLQQLTDGTAMQIGGDSGSGLYLPGKLFSEKIGTFNGGVYLGLLNGQGTVTVADQLTFTNDTYIRAAGGGKVVVAGNARIETNNDKKFTVQASDFTTGGNASISTGKGDLTLSVDKMDLDSTSTIASNGKWTLETWTKTEEKDYWIYLGGEGTGPGEGLWIKKTYFNTTSGVTPVFNPGTNSVIHFGNVDAQGKMLQTEGIKFKNEVVIDQGKNGGLGFEVAEGSNINTNGKDYSVNSQRANFNHVNVDAGAGNISINADYFTIEGSKFTGGSLTLDTFTKTQEISFGTGDSAGVLNGSWFTGETFKDAGPITIGSKDHTGGIKLTGELTSDYGLNLVTKGSITSDNTAHWNLSSQNLHMDAASIEVTNGVLTDVNKLTATSTGAIHIDNAAHNFAELGDVKGAGVTIKDQEGLKITGTVTSTGSGNNVSIWTKGDLVLGETAAIVSGKDAYLTAEEAHFKTDNIGTAEEVLQTTGRWVIFTKDSLGDDFGNLQGDFRRYDTEYGDTSQLTNAGGLPDYSGSGSAHKKNPLVTLSAEKVYGDSYGDFFGNGTLRLEIEGGEERLHADQAFLNGAYTFVDGIKKSDSYALGSYFTSDGGAKMQVNKHIHGNENQNGAAYGTENSEAAKQATYMADKNPLNYNIKVEFWVTPKEVTVTAQDATHTYNGQYWKPTDVKYTDWANDEGTENGANNGILTNDTLTFAYEGSADGQRNVNRDQDGNVRSYAVDLEGKLEADNYTFKYVDGTLTINPLAITVSTDDARREYGDANPETFNGGKLTSGTLASGDSLTNIGVKIDSSINEKTDAREEKYNDVVKVTDVTIADGNGGKNYNVTLENGDLKIDQRKITIVAGYDWKIYGEENPALKSTNFTVKGNGDKAGLVNGDTVSGITQTLDSSINSSSNVNVYNAITGSDAQFGTGKSSNYAITYEKGNFEIKKRKLVITANDIERVYGEENASLLREYKVGAKGNGVGLANGDTLSSVDVNYGVVDGEAINVKTHAGTYENRIDASNATFSKGAGNYEVEYVAGDMKITPREITIGAADATRVYGAQNPSLGSGTITAGSLANNDAIGAVQVGTTADVDSNAGDYAITPHSATFTSGLASDYHITYSNGKLTITPKEVVVTANDFSKIYDGLGYVAGMHGARYDGFVNGQDVTTAGITSGGLQYGGSASNANGAKDVGNYIIGLDGNLTAKNYTFTYKPGTLEITPKKLVIFANDDRKAQDSLPYGGYVGGNGVRYDGFVSGEDESVLTGALTYGGTSQNATDLGHYDITASGLTSGNYDIHYVDGTLTIYTAGTAESVEAAQVVSRPQTPDASKGDVVSVVPPVQEFALPEKPGGDVSVQVGGAAGGAYDFVLENGGFGLQLGYGGDAGDAARSHTSGAIPVLFADNADQKLDGIYTVNYNEGQKLAILPSAQGVTIPRLDEVSPDVRKDFSVVYKSAETGAFDVAFGNGIIAIYPLDEQAVRTVTDKEREKSKAILATGILTSIEDLGVMPDQLRAVYIFTELETD